jgi:hypothetical protein
MPCPPPAPIQGSDKVTAIGYGPANAIAAAKGAVSSKAVSDALDKTVCPESCRFKNPQSIAYTITNSGSSLTLFTFAANVLTVGMTWIFGEGLIQEGWAEFSWTATAVCEESQERVRISNP